MIFGCSEKNNNFARQEKDDMSTVLDTKDLNRLIVIGDKVLIKPRTPQSKTKSGLLLPPGINEKEQVQIGYVVKTGPGYPIPSVNEQDEIWKKSTEEQKYVPLQVKEGDQAVYLQANTIEVEFNEEKYVIVSQSAILLLLRDEGLFE